MKILFLTDNFPPEVNAPASRTWEHCRQWVEHGDEVTVITCAPNFPVGKVFPGYRNRLWSSETKEGIRIIRVWSYIAPNAGFLRRTLDFISFSVSSFLAGLFVKADLIVATSPQFFTALSGRTLARVRRKPWVMEVRDLWPESIKTVGAMKDNAIIRYLEREEASCYRSATRITVVTDSFRRELTAKGVDPAKIDVVTNGVDRSLFHPASCKDPLLMRELNLEGKTVVGYIGTHGMAHRLDFVLRCAASLEKSHPHFHFLLIGNGAERANLLRQLGELGLRNVTMLPGVAKDEVARYISLLDVSLVNLRNTPLFRTVIPSKIFENAAMGVPILLGVAGEARAIIERYGAGVAFEPEDEADFRRRLFEITEPDRLPFLKEGCLRLAEEYDRPRLAARMQAALHRAAGMPGTQAMPDFQTASDASRCSSPNPPVLLP